VDDDDAPIYVETVFIEDADPLLDYMPDPIDVLLDQCRTIIRLQEKIMSDQTELDAAVATLSAGIDKLEAREASESAAVPLDLSALTALAGRVDALDASGAAREPAPAAPVDAPAVPNDGSVPLDAAPAADAGTPVVASPAN
jgi:hypothetical protein